MSGESTRARLRALEKAVGAEDGVRLDYDLGQIIRRVIDGDTDVGPPWVPLEPGQPTLEERLAALHRVNL